MINQTQFEYNLRSQLTKVKDALDQEYLFTYDPLGRTLSQTRAGTTMSFEYDAVGNRTKRTDHNGTITNYTYDNLNRLTSGSNGTYTYDDLSRMLTATNSNGTVSFTYDNRGRADTTTDVYGKVIDYDYDANGNRTAMNLNGTNLVGYSYDNADRLASITNVPESAVTNYGYDVADRLISKALPNGITTTYSYDDISRLSRIKDANSTSTLLDRQYAYNTANQIASITYPTRTKTYFYDNVDRLTGVTDSISGSVESYVYNAVGNRTTSHLSSTYSHNPFNRLSSTASASYGYDNNGAMTSRTDSSGTMNFSYDSDGRLVFAYNDSWQFAEFRYDALGRRIYKSEPNDLPRSFTYDGEDMLVQNWAGFDSTYLNGPGIDNKLSAKLAGGTSSIYYHLDHLGTPTGNSNAAGSLTAYATPDSFGNGSFEFTGREYDSFTELYYYRARMYDPKLGRFISEDPIGFAGGDINLYGYVNNGPAMFRDPSGNIPIIPLIIGGAAIGALVLASPTPINAPGPCDRGYFPDNPLLVNAAGGQALGMAGGFVFNRFISPYVGRLMAGMGDDIITLGLPKPPTAPSAPVRTPNFLGQESGPAIPIPEGSTPIPIYNPGGKMTGFGYSGGAGGNGLSSRVTSVRIMDPTLPRGPSPGYPNGYVNYMNASGQAIDPYFGQTVAKSSKWWHLPLGQ